MKMTHCADYFEFREDVRALCKPGAYNLVLHRRLADVFYAIGAKDEFEITYDADLRFIVRPRHEFLMRMFGIDDYSVYDLDTLIKNNEGFRDNYFRGGPSDAKAIDMLENEMFQAVFPCLPVRDEPFVCENLLNNILNYPRFWAYRWASNMGVEEDFRFSIPKCVPEFSDTATEILARVAPLDKIVLFAPEAATATEFPAEFWDTIAERVHAHGYKIIVNGGKYKIRHGINAFDLGLSLSDVVALGLSCAYVFSLRSGLCDVLVGAREKLYAFYPAILHREMNSLNKCFDPKPNVREIAVWRWKIDNVIWEGEDLTKSLQKHVDKWHRGHIKAKVKSVLRWPFRRKRSRRKHWYRDMAGESRFFPENNRENESHQFRDRKISFLCLPVYSVTNVMKKPDGYVTKHSLLGRLAQLTNRGGNYRLFVLGVSLVSHNSRKTKLLGLTLRKYDYARKWFDDVQNRIGNEYDDIYILRHHIGESYVELMHMGSTIKANQSQKPLMLLWDKKYAGFYKMFLPPEMDMKYVDLNQSDILSIFDKETIVERGGRRFICTTPLIVQNMKKLMRTDPGINFYDHLVKAAGIDRNVKPVSPRPSEQAVQRVNSKMNRMELSGKFVILCPEANSLVELNDEFWEALAEGLGGKGYDVFVNVHEKECTLNNVKTAGMTIEEMFVLACRSDGIISLASGLAVLLTAAGKKMDLLYTGFDSDHVGYDSELTMRIYSVHHLPGVSGELVNEYDTMKWNGQNLLDAILKRY